MGTLPSSLRGVSVSMRNVGNLWSGGGWGGEGGGGVVEYRGLCNWTLADSTSPTGPDKNQYLSAALHFSFPCPKLFWTSPKFIQHLNMPWHFQPHLPISKWLLKSACPTGKSASPRLIQSHVYYSMSVAHPPASWTLIISPGLVSLCTFHQIVTHAKCHPEFSPEGFHFCCMYQRLQSYSLYDRHQDEVGGERIAKSEKHSKSVDILVILIISENYPYVLTGGEWEEGQNDRWWSASGSPRGFPKVHVSVAAGPQKPIASTGLHVVPPDQHCLDISVA